MASQSRSALSLARSQHILSHNRSACECGRSERLPVPASIARLSSTGPIGPSVHKGPQCRPTAKVGIFHLQPGYRPTCCLHLITKSYRSSCDASILSTFPFPCPANIYRQRPEREQGRPCLHQTPIGVRYLSIYLVPYRRDVIWLGPSPVEGSRPIDAGARPDWARQNSEGKMKIETKIKIKIKIKKRAGGWDHGKIPSLAPEALPKTPPCRAAELHPCGEGKPRNDDDAAEGVGMARSYFQPHLKLPGSL